jgi:hypothetical protein
MNNYFVKTQDKIYFLIYLSVIGFEGLGDWEDWVEEKGQEGTIGGCRKKGLGCLNH